MLAIDSAGVWVGRGSPSLSTAQTLVRSSLLRRLCSQISAIWLSLQWKWVKVHHLSFLQSMVSKNVHTWALKYIWLFCASLLNNQQLMKIIILLCLIYFGWPFHTLWLTPFVTYKWLYIYLGIKWSKHGPSDSWKHICTFFTLKWYIRIP